MPSFEPEIIFTFFGLKVSNTILATVLVDFLLISIVFSVHKKLSIYPKGLQNLFEYMIEYFYTLTEQIAGKRASAIFPWFASFFIFILFANILGLFPGFGTIGIFESGEGIKKFIPILRSATSDFNTTFALASISLIATHALSIKYVGIKDYLKRFFSFNPVFLFVGILELVGEFTKLFSLSFRLFGNIFAGEVVLSTISSLFAFIVPIPFLLLETIVALVQALVFAMLTMAFMSILTTPHGEESH